MEVRVALLLWEVRMKTVAPNTITDLMELNVNSLAIASASHPDAPLNLSAKEPEVQLTATDNTTNSKCDVFMIQCYLACSLNGVYAIQSISSSYGYRGASTEFGLVSTGQLLVCQKLSL